MLPWPDEAINDSVDSFYSRVLVGPKRAETDGGSKGRGSVRGDTAAVSASPAPQRAALTSREGSSASISGSGSKGSRAVLTQEPRPVSWRARPRRIDGNVIHE